jgi:WD40 repeat protein
MNDEWETMNGDRMSRFLQFIVHRSSFFVLMALSLSVSAMQPVRAQLETVDNTAPASVTWVSHGQIEGHLALNYSPAGAFSPESTTLAVVVGSKVVLMDLRGGAPRVLRPRVEGVNDLTIHSASFVAPARVFLLGNGVFIRGKGKAPLQGTPTLAFNWDAAKDVLEGKVNTIGESGGFTPPRYFPMIGYVGIYKESKFELWHPLTGQGGRLTVPSLTRRPNLYELSPDGHWLLLAQLEGGGGDPIVVDIHTGDFVDSLRGQQGTTLSIAFSRDNQRVVTACEDGKVRVWSVAGWKLLHTLAGHNGTVAWAEFSPDGRWIVSGGFDKTVRIWSSDDGSPIQTLSESKEPVRTVAFSPNGEFIAASGENTVWIWKAVRR